MAPPAAGMGWRRGGRWRWRRWRLLVQYRCPNRVCRCPIDWRRPRVRDRQKPVPSRSHVCSLQLLCRSKGRSRTRVCRVGGLRAAGTDTLMWVLLWEFHGGVCELAPARTPPPAHRPSRPPSAFGCMQMRSTVCAVKHTCCGHRAHCHPSGPLALAHPPPPALPFRPRPSLCRCWSSFP